MDRAHSFMMNFRVVKVRYNDECHYTFVQICRLYNTNVSPIVNYGLCRFIYRNKHSTLVGDADCGDYTCVGAAGTWEISVLSS